MKRARNSAIISKFNLEVSCVRLKYAPGTAWHCKVSENPPKENRHETDKINTEVLGHLTHLNFQIQTKRFPGMRNPTVISTIIQELFFALPMAPELDGIKAEIAEESQQVRLHLWEKKQLTLHIQRKVFHSHLLF